LLKNRLNNKKEFPIYIGSDYSIIVFQQVQAFLKEKSVLFALENQNIDFQVL
jgi:hypothetical protein